MRFTKMHGIGNDYIYVNCFEETVRDPSAMAIAMSDRHFGIGSDGLILIRPSEIADFEMDMYNADGTRGKMCGNGIRCVGKYVYDHGMTDRTELTIATLAGLRHLHLMVKDGKVSAVSVDMGEPELEAQEIPVVSEKEHVIDESVEVDGEPWRITCVSMGNPHCVVRVPDTSLVPIETIGPRFEHLPIFPDRVNTEFIQIIDRKTIRMRVWERGSGETLACGTGACAAAAACVLNGWTDREVTVQLLGGALDICWDSATGKIRMTGPAVTVFEGELPDGCF